jgi:2-polyprenyl-3-methyl-5-hydroxy-6-metoxy-1,4-benzoquinol methylase
MSDVLFRRLQYFLTPQFDVYQHISETVLPWEKLIDIGFGTGFGALYLHDKTGAFVTGVEFDADAVRFADRCLPGVRWEWGDISRGIEYIDKGYDVALMIEVLEHVSDWQLALRNTCDILKPGGRLIISARNANSYLRKNDLHEREWNAEEFVAALRQFFKKVELYDYQLKELQALDTKQTPLLAVAWKESDA